MSTKKTKKNTERSFASYAGAYIKAKYPYIILLIAAYLVASAINFLKISTTESIATFSIEDFEIGQIADRTIIADKSISASETDPVAIEAGEKVIKKGFPISEESYAKLKKMVASPLYIDYRAFANKELFLFLVAVLWYLLYSFVPLRHKLQLKELIFQIVCFFIVYSVAAFGQKLSFFSDSFAICMILPGSLFVMLVTILYGQLTAILLAFFMSLGILGATEWQIIPFLFTLVSAMTSTAVVRKIDRRLDLVFASIILSFLNLIFMLFLMVIFNQTFTNMPRVFIGVASNGFLSGILTLGLLAPLEYILNTASVFRLIDLSDLNNALMRKMLVTASGTYNHSLMVAQLAESACREIGANALVARVGAYYHDIGKIDQSEYFVENQSNGINKHDKLKPSLSAAILRSHVTKGVEKAHELRLPQPIIDIIAEHHGNGLIAYFYNQAKNEDPNVNPEDFCYKGNPPSTRESAVVMLADTVEAACKTLENPTADRLEKFITTLFNGKIDGKQLDNCDLTFRDISKIKKAFVQILVGYYHSRIEYPDQKDPEEAEKKAGAEKKAEESAAKKTRSKKAKNDASPENPSEAESDAKKSDDGALNGK